jgi:deoxycytidine triphosphate deaminase
MESATDIAGLGQRADWWEFVDPFGDLQPSLLTAEQIANYVRVTGLLSPFDETHLKGATYEVGIARNAYSWDENKKKKLVSVSEQGQKGIVLEPNSITFVETDVEFRLPQYIAIRFNLHIKLVHRGLLLGTGPIVDPGFRGRLLIPLHNLTSSPYTIAEGEKIIWIEFTKTLFGRASMDEGYRKQGLTFRVFPKNKRWLGPDAYFAKANAGNPIMSSISGFIAKTNKRAKKTERKVNGLAIVGLISLAAGLTGAIWGSWSVYNNAIGIVKADESRRAQLEARVRHLEECDAITNRPSVDSLGKAC